MDLMDRIMQCTETALELDSFRLSLLPFTSQSQLVHNTVSDGTATENSVVFFALKDILLALFNNIQPTLGGASPTHTHPPPPPPPPPTPPSRLYSLFIVLSSAQERYCTTDRKMLTHWRELC